MIEEWRPIEGFEGLYEVSNTGRVRSLDRYDSNNHFLKGKVLSLLKGKYGYLQVNLHYNGKMYKKYVHRIVAQTFILNPYNLPEVNHRDEDKTNNRVDNLEFCDRTYNMNFGTRQERYRNTMLERGHWTGLSRKESMKKYSKKYYQENKDRICEQQKKYYQENRDRICEQQKEYYQENRDRICEQKKEFYRKKKEQIQNNVKSLND